ncbi:MAG: hypothetical protein AAFU77_03910 [Myxococcota bacterium]
MSKDKELRERIAKIKKLQERQRQSANTASENAADLDEILAVSRAEHEGGDPDRRLRSASELLGPGGRPGGRRGATMDTESAFDRNMSAAHFASPEAFSRNRSKPPPVLGPGGAISPVGARSIQRPGQTSPNREAKPASNSEPRPAPLSGGTDETTLVVRARKTPRETEPAETQVIRARKIPKDAIGADGSVQPTDHIETLPGAGGRVDPNERTSPGVAALPPSETLVIRERKTPRDAIAPQRKEEPVEPTDHVATAPGMAGLERITTTERTEVVRRRRLHPDSVDPNTGDVLPTDHVVTAPGMAGLSANPAEQTQVLKPTAKKNEPEETLVVRQRKLPKE